MAKIKKPSENSEGFAILHKVEKTNHNKLQLEIFYNF